MEDTLKRRFFYDQAFAIYGGEVSALLNTLAIHHAVCCTSNDMSVQVRGVESHPDKSRCKRRLSFRPSRKPHLSLLKESSADQTGGIWRGFCLAGIEACTDVGNCG